MRTAVRLLPLITVAAVVALGAPALAFHDHGVAHCNGCHTMHNSQDGIFVDPAHPAGNQYLLVDATPSDVCLGCHATRLGAVFAVDELNPAPMKGGGNFIFLLEDNLNDAHAGGDGICSDGVSTDEATCIGGGGTWTWDNAISGDAAGHNLNAPGHGLAADGTLNQAPGGIFNSAGLGCSSCHDPHGNANFRMLYGVGAIQGGAYTFTKAAPTGDGLSIFFGSEGPTSHTAYNSGWSNWCANCHNDFHNLTYPTVLKHPSGAALGAGIAAIYNAYNGTDNQSGGAAATAYLAEVPFQDAAVTTGSTAGPSGSSQVMCMTCHRAHASSAPDAGRWDFSVTFLHEDAAESGSYAIPDPYSSLNQRSLCNKCHNKDAGDAPFS